MAIVEEQLAPNCRECRAGLAQLEQYLIAFDCPEHGRIVVDLAHDRSQLAIAQAQLIVLQRELDQERRRFPADGLWLVTPSSGGQSQVCITQIAALPEPVLFASIARHRDAIAEAIHRSWQVYHDTGHQAPLDVADAIMSALHQRLRLELAAGEESA